MSAATTLLRVAPVATSAELMEPEKVVHHEMFDRGHGFTALPGKTIALCVNHEKDNIIGHVSDLFSNEDPSGGRWMFALAHLDEVPEWLERGSGVSISRSATFHKTMVPGGWELLRKGLITEISVLSPGIEPAFPRARVMTLTRSPATGSATSDRAPSPAKYQDELSRLGYTDGDVEQFVTAAQRSPLDKVYDEHTASRVPATRLLVRPGIGQVLAVR